MIDNNRPNAVLRSMQTLLNNSRLAGTSSTCRFYQSIREGIEHSAGVLFAANPLYFDPKNIVELAIEAGCNYVASTYGVLALVSRRYALKIQFLVKLNHNETLSYPTQIAFERTHELVLVTVLWAYLRNQAFNKDGVDYHYSADLTDQANHIAATLGADIVKQKMAENNSVYRAVKLGYTDDRVYSRLTSDHPIDLMRYQLVNCYMGRA